MVDSYNDLTDLPVLFSGSCDEIGDKPDIPTADHVQTMISHSKFSFDDITGVPALFSGSYNDFDDKPVLIDLADVGRVSASSNLATSNELIQYVNANAVGSYNDLTDLPALFSGSWNNLSDKPVFIKLADIGRVSASSNLATSNELIQYIDANTGKDSGEVEANCSNYTNNVEHGITSIINSTSKLYLKTMLSLIETEKNTFNALITYIDDSAEEVEALSSYYTNNVKTDITSLTSTTSKLFLKTMISIVEDDTETKTRIKNTSNELIQYVDANAGAGSYNDLTDLPDIVLRTSPNFLGGITSFSGITLSDSLNKIEYVSSHTMTYDGGNGSGTGGHRFRVQDPLNTFNDILYIAKTSVGINTITPNTAYKLDVNGDVNCTGSFRVNGTALTSFSGACNDVTSKPMTFPSTWATVSGIPTTFPSTWATVSGIPTTFPSTWNTVSGKPALFDGECNSLENKLKAFYFQKSTDIEF